MNAEHTETRSLFSRRPRLSRSRHVSYLSDTYEETDKDAFSFNWVHLPEKESLRRSYRTSLPMIPAKFSKAETPRVISYYHLIRWFRKVRKQMKKFNSQPSQLTQRWNLLKDIQFMEWLLRRNLASFYPPESIVNQIDEASYKHQRKLLQHLCVFAQQLETFSEPVENPPDFYYSDLYIGVDMTCSSEKANDLILADTPLIFINIEDGMALYQIDSNIIPPFPNRKLQFLSSELDWIASLNHQLDYLDTFLDNFYSPGEDLKSWQSTHSLKRVCKHQQRIKSILKRVSFYQKYSSSPREILLEITSHAYDIQKGLSSVQNTLTECYSGFQSAYRSMWKVIESLSYRYLPTSNTDMLPLLVQCRNKLLKWDPQDHRFKSPQTGLKASSKCEKFLCDILTKAYSLLSQLFTTIDTPLLVDISLMPVQKSLLSLRKCLRELKRVYSRPSHFIVFLEEDEESPPESVLGTPSTSLSLSQALYPLRCQLNQLDSLRLQHNHQWRVNESSDIPKGQAILTSLLEECYDLLKGLTEISQKEDNFQKPFYYSKVSQLENPIFDKNKLGFSLREQATSSKDSHTVSMDETIELQGNSSNRVRLESSTSSSENEDLISQLTHCDILELKYDLPVVSHRP